MHYSNFVLVFHEYYENPEVVVDGDVEQLVIGGFQLRPDLGAWHDEHIILI